MMNYENLLTNANPRSTFQLRLLVEQERRRRVARSTQPAITFRANHQIAQSITDPLWLLSGPAETGKTWAALHRLDSEARKYPNSQWLLVRKIRATMDSTVLNTWRRVIALRGGVVPFGGEKPQWYDYPNGARVWIVGFDKPDKILSGEFDGAVINQAEELAEADIETLTTRVTGRGAVTATPMVWGDCNPSAEDHWIIKKRDTNTLTLLATTHKDNPTLWDDQAQQWTAQGQRSMEVLNRLTGVRRSRLRDGLWVGTEGAFFTQIDIALHVLSTPVYPQPSWLTWAALDYGFAHPLAFGVFTLRPDDGAVIMLGYHSAARWYLTQHAPKMDEVLERCKVAKRGLRVEAGHDCWAKGKDQTETVADKFKTLGYTLTRATIDRAIGAQAVSERLGNPEAGIAPTLFFNPWCAPVVLHLASMKTNPNDQEDVLKVNADEHGRGGDDLYDMVRYGVMGTPRLYGGGVAVGGKRGL